MDLTERTHPDEEHERLLASERAALTEAVAAQQRFRDLVNSVEGIVWEADAQTFQFLFVSKQAERILGYPVERWLSEPTFWADHLHPDDRERAVQFCEEAVADKRDHDFEYRIIAADGRAVWVRELVSVVVQGDRATRLRGVMVDITERKRAEEERHAHLWFFESMDRINRAIQGTNDLEQMMSDVLAEVLSIFNCDRAWLVYPCDPEAPSWGVPMEHTRPECPGAFALGHVPMDPDVAGLFQAVRACSGPVRFGPGSEHPLPEEVARRFGIRSQVSMAVYPKGDRPYMFGLHQCSHPRVWTPQEERLFQEIGRRLADALTSLLMFRILRESEARLEEAQRIAHVGHWERDLETNRVTWSDETYRIFGMAPQRDGRFDFTKVQELIHPEDRQSMVRASAAAERGGPRYDVEYRVVRPNGEVRIVHSQGDVRKDDSGRPQRIFGILQDITERKRAEAEVRESEQRYRYIFQSTGVSIWEQDFSRVKDAIDDLKARSVLDFREYCAAHPEFVERATAMVRIADVNDATVKLFAAESRDQILLSLHRIALPETAESFVGALVAIAEGRTSFKAETVLQTLNGEKLTVLVTMTLPPPPGRLDKVLLTLVDITERKRAEYLTAQVFESSPDRVAIVGRDYRYRRVNPVSERYWNMPAETIVGKHVADLMGVEIFEQVKPHLDRCFAGEDVSHAEWYSRAGRRQYLALSYSPLRPDSDRVDAALVIVRDLTEQMLASEALRQAHAELAHISRVTTMGELTASLAHEINQPIAAAITNANACLRWLARDAPDVEEARKAASRIVKDGTRAADIISRIRLLFKKGVPQRESVDVNEVIKEMIVLLRGEAARYSIPIRADLAAGLPKVKADRVQLQQVFMNLMLNGIDAIKELSAAGELTVKSERAESGLMISVSDTGVGLPPQQAARIFDAFFTTKTEGTGMGLPISRTIVESHGGRLWAAANSERGATFHFTLPSEDDARQ
jgi:PAS domain S-box-containing protein